MIAEAKPNDGHVCPNGNGQRPLSELLAPYDVRVHDDLVRRRKNRHLLRSVYRVGALLLTDIVVLSLAYLAAIFLRQDVLPILVPVLPPMEFGLPLKLWPAALAVQLMSLSAFGAYTPGKGRRDYYKLFGAIVVGTLILFFGATVYAPDMPSQALFVLAGFTAVCGVLPFRWAVDRAVVRYRKRHNLGRPALLLGREDQIPFIRSHFDETPEANIRFVRTMHFDEVEVPTRHCVATERLTEVLLSSDIEVVVVAGDLPNGMARRVLDRCLHAGCQVMLVPSVLHEIPNPVSTEDMSGLFALAVTQPRLGIPQLALKRIFDFAISGLGLILAAPLFGVIALAIKLDSKGTVFFKQQRVGLGGGTFWIYKFRTMVRDAEARKNELGHLNQYCDGKFFKIKDDPRVTRTGRFLRRASLDELPQLINVLRGEMSLVGPRPPVPEEVLGYSEHHLQRLSVTPGITGLWQVKGRSDILDFEEVVRLDLEYIRTWSVWKDLAILIKTVPVVIQTDGAA